MKEELKDARTVTFRLSQKEHRDLKKIAFYQEVYISDLIREGVALVVKKYKKIPTKSDL